MEQDYDLEEDYAPRVLWGRLAFLLIVLVLAFTVGRCTAGDGVPQSDFSALQTEVQELSSENTVLRAQLEAAAGQPEGEGEGDGDGGQGQDAEADGEETEAVNEDGQTYTVQANDTLTRIANQFYDDPRKWTLIADANNLNQETQLRVGQELVIPPDN